MFRIDDATAATSLPTPETAGTEGYFTEGDPVAGTPATNVRGSWLNMIQEELCAILAAAGITRSKTSYNQVNAALQKMYSPVVGTARNLAMSVAAASATATLTADEIVVGAALGGQKYMLPSFSKTINLATTGAGGMDTGTAPALGYVALYAIYNPATGASALLATNATSAVAPNVYGGANMPSGYTASGLISVYPTNSSRQFIAGYQRDRTVYFANALLLSSTTATGSNTTLTALSVSSSIPINATSINGFALITNSAAGVQNLTIGGTTTGIGLQQVSLNTVGGNAGAIVSNYANVPIITAQTIYYGSTVSGSTTTSYNINASSYTF